MQEILSLPNGARFYRCDLHSHTPVDNRFHCAGWSIQTEEQKTNFAEHFVRYLKENRKLDILGVTEHNDVSWLPYIQKAADAIGLIVFPGVELGALAGQKAIHFIALFNPGTPATEIDHWLSSIGLLPNNRFHPDKTPKVAQLHTYELTDHITRNTDGLPGIVFAAHVSTRNGLFQDMEGESRIIAYNDTKLLAVEIPGSREKLSNFERMLVNGEMNSYGNKRVACLNSSDGRCVEDQPNLPAVGSKYTYIKLSRPTIEGLRQAFLDFDSRVRLKNERIHHQYPRIIGISVENGFLRDKDGNSFRIHFNPNLNCCIGGRGSGKSALLEIIRYVFDIPFKADTNAQHSNSLLKHVLGPGSKVVAFYETEDETAYRIERIWGQTPQVFGVQSNDLKQGLMPNFLTPNGAIEVYGQKEIYEISKDATFQLRLIDNYIADELHPIEDKERNLIRQLESNAKEIQTLTEELDDWNNKLTRFPAIKEELIRLERQEFISRLEKKRKFDEDNDSIKSTQRLAEKLINQLSEFITTIEADIHVPEITSNKNGTSSPIIESQVQLISEMRNLFLEVISDLPDRLKAIWERGIQERENWINIYLSVEDEFTRLIKEIPNASADRYIRLQQNVSSLNDLSKRASTHATRIEQLKSQRIKLLEQLRKNRRIDAFGIRSKKIDQINTATSETFSISIILEGNREEYATKLRAIFSGSRLTSTAIDNISTTKSEDETYYDPIHLVEAIRSERERNPETPSTLTEIYKITPTFCQKLASLPDSVLCELETYKVPDKPVIKLKIGDKYRDLDELSVGQRCTAILSLILLERKTPLIIDQPEDDLDNRFIFEDIVKTLRKEKERRQFIIATHNANIPVSGDAELIVVLDADEKMGWINSIGSIDDDQVRNPVESILEGGRNAFRIRKEKYGI